MEDKEKIKENDMNEITIIYDFSKSREFEIDHSYSVKVKEATGESMSKEKLFGEIFVKNNKNR